MDEKLLLHFVAFFHVASLFSTEVDNEKVGVAGNGLAWVQQVQKPADLWYIIYTHPDETLFFLIFTYLRGRSH